MDLTSENSKPLRQVGEHLSSLGLDSLAKVDSLDLLSKTRVCPKLIGLRPLCRQALRVLLFSKCSLIDSNSTKISYLR